MAIRSRTQRSLLRGFVVSIVVCGVVGMYCLAVGSIGDIELHVLLTTAAIGGSSILLMAAAVAWERRRWHPVGPLGMAAVASSLLLTLVVIWSDWHSGLEWVAKALGISWVLAVALPHVGLVSVARLRSQWRGVQIATAVAVLGLGTWLIKLILTRFDIGDAEIRFIGILAIAVASGTILMPILHRLSVVAVRESVRSVELLLTIICPRCGKQQELAAGRSKCGQCGLRFVIEIEEDNCRKCGYPLYGLQSAVCPECGTPISTQPAAVGGLP